jgi:hypothetical protein
MYVHQFVTLQSCLAAFREDRAMRRLARRTYGEQRLPTSVAAVERAVYCLRNGLGHAESPFLKVAEVSCLPGAPALLLALAEPVEHALGDEDVAAAVIAGIRRWIETAGEDDLIPALHAAYSEANARLLAANRTRGGRRRILLGLTCVVGCGADVLVVQVPPGQLLVRQDESLHAFPPLVSWSPVYQPSQTLDLPNPLGLRSPIEPRLYYTRVEPGDLMMVASSSMARLLTPVEEELRDAAGVDDAIDTLADVCDRHGVTWARPERWRFGRLRRSGRCTGRAPGFPPGHARAVRFGDRRQLPTGAGS